MWITDNTEDVLDNIERLDDEHKANDINTYDFSTLYTNIPHDDLKLKMRDYRYCFL